MSITFMILLMIFCHIVDDYYLQGWLASAKQKEWWMKNAPGKLYEKDYVWALLMHSFSWSFMIMLPIAIYTGFEVGAMYIVGVILNTAVHALTDDLKANQKFINLWWDQIIHLIQIACTALIFIEGYVR